MMNKKSKILHICKLFGIIWTMVSLFSFSCIAKTAFTKQKPVGVMSTAVKNQIAVSWEPVTGASGYEIYEEKKPQEANGTEYEESTTDFFCAATVESKTCQYVFKAREAGAEYCYYVRAYKTAGDGKRTYSKKSVVVSTTVAVNATSTVKNFLKTAIAPIGSTMYVWGGGWNKADTGAGTDAKRIGLSPAWRSFAKNKKASYNYKNYRYQIHNGLDCSGYVGWVVYNVLNTKMSKKGYVYSASKQAKIFSKAGFGSYTEASKVKDYKAGDIMSSTCKCCGHVWIVIGQCEDGSVVLVHSSPAGVQINGTVTPGGTKNSQAVKLSQKYMKKYYSQWYNRYPKMDRGSSYLSHYGQMRWLTSGDKVILSDPDGYQNMSPEEILRDLFDEN